MATAAAGVMAAAISGEKKKKKKRWHQHGGHREIMAAKKIIIMALKMKNLKSIKVDGIGENRRRKRAKAQRQHGMAALSTGAISASVA
jgi:hypothetical protein